MDWCGIVRLLICIHVYMCVLLYVGGVQSLSDDVKKREYDEELRTKLLMDHLMKGNGRGGGGGGQEQVRYALQTKHSMKYNVSDKVEKTSLCTSHHYHRHYCCCHYCVYLLFICILTLRYRCCRCHH